MKCLSRFDRAMALASSPGWEDDTILDVHNIVVD
jgi:hypothetical protein